jgi:hypothetical protein
MKRIFIILFILIFSSCDIFLSDDKNNENNNTKLNKDPEYYGVWVRKETDGTVFEIEINKNSFIERTYVDGIKTLETKKNNYSILPQPNYWTSSMNGNKNFYYEMRFENYRFLTNFEIVDNKLKIGGGDISYFRLTGTGDSLEGKWRWQNDRYTFNISFLQYQNDNNIGVFIIESTYNIINGWMGVKGSFIKDNNNLVGIYIDDLILNRKIFNIDNNKLIISDYFFDNGKIKEYNDNNPSDTIDYEMFGFFFDTQARNYILQDYFAKEYHRK